MKEIEVELGEGLKTAFKCEEDVWVSAEAILSGREYANDVNFPNSPVIIDIGANVGAFGVWSIKRWNPSYVLCFEPLKRNFAQLEQNINNLPSSITTKFILINKAVEAPSSKLYVGKYSTAGSSFYKNDRQHLDEFEEVENVPAIKLPDCAILKVDTEGCEIPIITSYLHSHNRPILILLEYHSDSDRVELDRLLSNFHFKLCSGGIIGYGLGVLGYANMFAVNLDTLYI